MVHGIFTCNVSSLEDAMTYVTIRKPSLRVFMPWLDLGNIVYLLTRFL